MNDVMHFEASARLQKYLGKELIADPNLAIIEFVKNAYDAGASHVLVAFELNREPSRLVISDDGIGMDEASFRENWLRPGFSKKSSDYRGPRNARTSNADARRRAEERTPAGEKGLGRLAAGRLGERLRLWTRPSQDSKWLAVDITWSTFDDMNRAMNQVPIHYEYQTSLPPEAAIASYNVGTVVEISGLTQSWVGRVRGRPVPGRRRTRLGRLKQDLEFLVRPLEGGTASFEVVLMSDSFSDPADIGVISPQVSSQTADYTYEFHIESNEADEVVVRRVLSRSPEVAKQIGRPAREDRGKLVISPSVALSQERPGTLVCGPFSGTFYYSPPPAAKRAREVDAVGAGVLLYRDNILVEPYGLPGDDWVGVEARKASRQGHAAIQPTTFSGAVRISRASNPLLEDMSNRLGLLDNEASADLFGHVRAEFAAFEQIIYEEVVQPRWKPKEERASEQARVAQTLATTRVRAIAHSLGQPIQALGFEVLRLENFGKRHALAPEAAAELEAIRSRIELHLQRISGTTRKFADFELPEFSPVAVGDLLNEALDAVAGLAAAEGVCLELEHTDTVDVMVPKALVVSALEELLTNSVEADRPVDRRATVLISARIADSNAVDVMIRDNGTGFVGVAAGSSLSDIQSTKGRPSEGLPTVVNAVVSSNGAIRLVETGTMGTTIVVRLPRGVKPVSA